jgi:hypothetical protein
MNSRTKILLVALVCALNAGYGATNNWFAQGVESTRDGDFPGAAAAFKNAAQTRPAAGTFVNVGLAEWNRGRAGAAILAWEQARWIDPFDPRAITNLKFARQVAEVESPQLKWYESASSWLPPNAWVWIAGASLWLAVGALVVPRVLRCNRRGWHQTVAALGFGAFLFGLTANFGVVGRTDIGFVIKKTAPLLLTPTHDGEIISSLSAGEPARRLRTRGNYYYIRTSGASGWIDKSQFGLVCTETEK